MKRDARAGIRFGGRCVTDSVTNEPGGQVPFAENSPVDEDPQVSSLVFCAAAAATAGPVARPERPAKPARPLTPWPPIQLPNANSASSSSSSSGSGAGGGGCRRRMAAGSVRRVCALRIAQPGWVVARAAGTLRRAVGRSHAHAAAAWRLPPRRQLPQIKSRARPHSPSADCRAFRRRPPFPSFFLAGCKRSLLPVSPGIRSVADAAITPSGT
eukprot:349634-Chlamydomonas_euryale.AAC.6